MAGDKNYSKRRFEGPDNYNKARKERESYLENVEKRRQLVHHRKYRATYKDAKRAEHLEKQFEKGKKDKRLLEEQIEDGLARKLPVFILFVIGGIALVIGSMRITGDVVSGLTETTPGLLGVVLFIAGLVGMLSHRRK